MADGADAQVEEVLRLRPLVREGDVVDELLLEPTLESMLDPAVPVPPAPEWGDFEDDQ